MGWGKSPGATTVVDLVEESFTESVELYAVWSEIFTVTFDGNSGDWGEDITKVEDVPTAYGSVLYFPNEPTKEGYEFTGWKKSQDSSGSEFRMDTSVTEQTTVYAQWKILAAGTRSIVASAGDTVTYGEDYETTIVADIGYSLPSSITITVDGIELETDEYEYDSTTGDVRIYGEYIIGPVVIIATGDALPEIYNVTWNVTNGSKTVGGATATEGVAYSGTVVATTGYKLPTTITVQVGGNTLTEGTDYTYNSSDGKIIISAISVTDNISITVVCKRKTFGVIDNVEHGTFTGDAATYGIDYDTTIIPDNGYKPPSSIVVMVDGVILTSGYTYDSTTGAVHIDGEQITGVVVITASAVSEEVTTEATTEAPPASVEETTQQPVVEPKKESPQTGDDMMTALWMSLMMLSGVGLILLGKRGKLNK